MKVKLILSFFVVVVCVLVINVISTYAIDNPITRMWISAAVGLAVGMGLGYLISRSMVSGLKELSTVAREISSGDLTKEVEVPDDEEIGDLARAFRTMVRELNTVVSQVQGNATTLNASAKGLSSSAQQMSASAQEIASATEHIAKGAEVQVEGVTKASSRIKESAVSMDQIAGRAGEIAAASKAAGDAAQGGGEAVSSALTKMGEVFEQMESSTELVHGFEERTQKIGKIVEVITGISQQTNLLALNATIEAARAGEYGRGFAVVADEVRKLSEKTQKSAEEITDLISQFAGESKEVLSTMVAGNAVITEGREVIDTVRSSLDGIIASSVEVAGRVQEISSQAEEQNRRTVDMVGTTDEIFRIAEDNAAATEEASAATEELTASMEEMAASSQSISQLAEDMQKLVSRFSVKG
jgi:methyl-accepting chemotaxis protein